VEIVVRPFTEDDAAPLGAAIAASLEHLRPWMAWAAEEPHELAWHRDRIRTGIADEAAGGDRLRGVFAGDEVVGGCGLHRRLGPDGYEIGYWVRAGWTGRGVATAAVGHLAVEAFADPAIACVEIHHDVANVASGAVARAAGFTVVGGQEGPPRSRAPSDTGVDRIWRLTRAQYEKRT
jgi:ribosomal-protein-serine acetyltransferase